MMILEINPLNIFVGLSINPFKFLKKDIVHEASSNQNADNTKVKNMKYITPSPTKT